MRRRRGPAVMVLALSATLIACTPARQSTTPTVPTIAAEPLGVGPAAAALTSDPSPGGPDVNGLTIGPGAVDTTTGSIPDGQMISPFDVATPAVALLDPLLRKAIQDAKQAAVADGINLLLTSGWRSRGFQQRLFDQAVSTYGSVDVARQFVASADVSSHVVGKAVDVGPTNADDWLIRNGSRFGLCQIYANEIWHFELVADALGGCPPLRPNAAG